MGEASSSIGSPTYWSVQLPTFSSFKAIWDRSRLSKTKFQFNRELGQKKMVSFALCSECSIIHKTRVHSFMETHKVNDPFFNWWSILIWWVVLILTSWTIYLDELRWYRNDLSWVVNLYNSIDHNCLWWACRNHQSSQRIVIMQRYSSTCQNHYWYMLIKVNHHSTQ